MGTETMDYAEEEVLTETGIETLTKAETEASIEALTESSAEALTETSAEALTEEQAEVLEEMETPALKEDEEIPSSELSSELSSDLSDPFEEMDAFPYSETEEGVVFDWQEDLSACRASLDSLVSLLLFGDIALCLLLDCLCASIFSAFWKVNR